MEIEIIVDFTSIRFGRDGLATGIIYWRLRHFKFPEAGWNDFVLVVIESWINALQRLCAKESNSEQLRFMDGPFWVSLTAFGNLIDVKFIDGRGRETICENVQLTREELCYAVLRSALDLCRFYRLQNRDPHQINCLWKTCEAVERLLNQ